MERIARMTALLCLTGFFALAGVGCSGGGRTAVIGFGNHGNSLGAGELGEEVAEALADSEATPRVTDKMIADIFGAILKGAEEGNPEAALIVLKVAEEQREAEDG